MRQTAVAAPGREISRGWLYYVAPVVPALALIFAAAGVHYTADFGLAYRGGVEAWNTGRPQSLASWTATPFLGLVMALVSRAASPEAGARGLMTINLALWAVLVCAVWYRLREQVPTRWWWATLVAAAIFAPVIQTIFWLQFNLIVFALALGGFVLIGRRNAAAGVLIGLSVAIKPIVILLPIGLMVHRWSRRAGIWSVATAAAMTALGLAFLAWRAGDAHLLNPFAYLAGFESKGAAPIFACVPENYTPVALLCRLGLPPSSWLTAAIALGVLAVAWLLIRRSPDSEAGHWQVFAACCVLSPMVSPIAWSSYGVLMGPLLLLLAYEFWGGKAPARLWVGLALAYVLADLIWDPLESLARAPVLLVIASYSVGQFGQYVLLLVWVRWRLLQAARA